MKIYQSKSVAIVTTLVIVTLLLSACMPAAARTQVQVQAPAAGTTAPVSQAPAPTAVPTTTPAESTTAPMTMPATVPSKPTGGIDPLAFQQAMRKLWEDHVTWTRVYIIAALAGLPEADTAAGRLLQNQADIGNAIKPFYGEMAGDQLTALLRDHILIAAELLGEAKAGDTAKFKDTSQRWYDNADQIAAFLNYANPKSWPLSDVQSMMKSHLDLTLEEATARLKKDWTGDVAAYDKIHDEILMMADALSGGIIAQFPDKFAPEKASKAQIKLTLGMDKLWEDHVTWTRIYIMSATSNLPDTAAAATRLLQNQVDIGNAIKPFYGEGGGAQLTALLKDHILTAVDLLAAAKAGNNAKLQQASQRWYDNASQIAGLLNSANPKSWALSDMQSMMKTHLDLTLAEATARLQKDWTGDVSAYDKVHAEILQMSGMLSQGIVAQFPEQFK